MKDNGIVLFEDSQYYFYLNDTDIMLFPITNDSNNSLYKHYGNQSWPITMDGSRGIRGAVWKHTALIINTSFPFNNVAELKAKCVFSRWNCCKVNGFELFGEAIDDLFFCKNIYGRDKEKFSKAMGQEVTVIDTWNVAAKDRNVLVEFLYGNVLSSNGRMNKECHPFFRVTVSGDEDFPVIYNAYLAMMNFIKIVRYRSTCGKIDFKLLNADNGYTRIGAAYHTTATQKFSQRYVLPNLDLWQGSINNILDLVFNDNSIDIDYFPKKGLHYLPEDYTTTIISNLFTAFEKECHKNKEIFEKVNCSNVDDLRERVIKLLKVEKKADLSEAEGKFIDLCIDRVGQVGTQMGQGKKLTNAFEFLIPVLEPVVEKIVKTHMYVYKRCIGANINVREEVIKYLKMIPELRARILHDGDSTVISSDETLALNILEVIVYTQILKRAALSDNEITNILQFNFEFTKGNYTYLIPDPD